MSSQAGPPSVDRRLERMERALRRVERIHDRDPEPGETASLALLRELQVATQACLDTGATWLCEHDDEGAVPSSFVEVFDRLVDSRLLAAELGIRLRGVATLRNRLVFDYVDDVGPDGGLLRAAAAEDAADDDTSPGNSAADAGRDPGDPIVDDLARLRTGLFDAMRDFARAARDAGIASAPVRRDAFSA